MTSRILSLVAQGGEVWLHHVPVFRACRLIAEERPLAQEEERALLPAQLWWPGALLLDQIC